MALPEHILWWRDKPSAEKYDLLFKYGYYEELEIARQKYLRLDELTFDDMRTIYEFHTIQLPSIIKGESYA